MHPAAVLQFERMIGEYSAWRAIPEAERSPAPAWWWGPAIALRAASEPLPAGSPLRDAPNLILSPHIGFVTQRALRLGYSQMLEDIQAFQAGHPINVLG